MKTKHKKLRVLQQAIVDSVMKCSLEDVHKLDRKQITLRKMLRHRRFERVMESLLPTGEVEYIGAIYLQAGINFFRNEYLRDLLESKPEYNEYMRVFAGHDDFRTSKIERVEDKHEVAHTLDQMFER